MTDNEIIKTLECCVNADCENCPSKTICDSDTERFVIDIFALINRQKETIELLQTALFECGKEMVEVVRCKDCTEYNGHRYCNYHADPVEDNDYCSYGERKEQK